VDAASAPHIAPPSHWRRETVGVAPGCKAAIEDTKTGKLLKAAGVPEIGPQAKLGEASIACAEFFGVPSSPKNGARARSDSSGRFSPASPK
jgi:hypothetical protein